MEKLKTYKFEILIFITESIYMCLELLASRVLSPTFGTTLEVWTSIIGIILLASAMGNYFGGKLADKNKDNTISVILLLAGVFVFFIPMISNFFINYNLSFIKWNEKVLLTVILSLVLFFIPTLLIGMLTPIVITKEINKNKTVGSSSGKIYSAMTMGGLFGTFISGFYLIPNIGTEKLLYIISIILVLLSFITSTKKIKSLIVYLIISFVMCFNLVRIVNNEKEQLKIENNKIYVDTKYGRAVISEGKYDNKDVKVLNIDGGFESFMYTNEKEKNQLVTLYTKKYLDAIDLHKNPKDLLMIGGGAYTFPKYIAVNTKYSIDVVEIDEKITEIAKKYFNLDEIMKDYPNRIKIFTEDGRVYLNQNNKKYDIIFNDAFSGNTPVVTLATKEAVQKIKKSLREDGIYATNIISAIQGEESLFLKYELKTIKEEFKYVYVTTTDTKSKDTKKQNLVIFASDKKYDFKNTIEVDIKDAKILTDDYSPVEYLTK